MEQWQIDAIQNRLADLVEYTDPNVSLTAAMSSKKILSRGDVDDIKSQGATRKRAEQFYTLIVSRGDANTYDFLIDTLESREVRQTKAARILKEGKIEAERRVQIESLSEILDRHAYSLEETQQILDFVESKDHLKVSVKRRTNAQHGRSPYDMPPRGKGYALILNIIEVKGYKPREGSDLDAKYMSELWRQLGFRIFPENEDIRYRKRSWSAEEIEEVAEAFHKKCQEDSVDAMVVFIGSHGNRDSIAASDGIEMSLHNDFIYKMQLDNCKQEKEKRRAKIFIVEACQGFSPNGRMSTGPRRVQPKDTILIKPQAPGAPASRDIYRGSWFVVAFTYVFMVNACNFEFFHLLNDVKKLVAVISDFKIKGEAAGEYQLPTYEPLGLEPFFFTP